MDGGARAGARAARRSSGSALSVDGESEKATALDAKLSRCGDNVLETLGISISMSARALRIISVADGGLVTEADMQVIRFIEVCVYIVSLGFY
jgi:hypothetical protein